MNTFSVINERKQEAPERRWRLRALKAADKRHVGQAACARHGHQDLRPHGVIKQDC